MTRDITASIRGAIVLTILLGVIYPLLVTGIARVVMPDASGGSTVSSHGKIVGSSRIAQAFDRPVRGRNGAVSTDADGNELREPDPAWFQPRPSQTGYAGNASGFLNEGPNQQDLADTLAGYQKAYLKLERPYNPGLRWADLPVDAVTNSASGVDPHISIDNARIQAARVAKQRGASVKAVRALIDQHVDGRFLGIFGEPGVNVLELNLALEKEYPQR